MWHDEDKHIRDSVVLPNRPAREYTGLQSVGDRCHNDQIYRLLYCVAAASSAGFQVSTLVKAGRSWSVLAANST